MEIDYKAVVGSKPVRRLVVPRPDPESRRWMARSP
jgi:hypothetical protein